MESKKPTNQASLVAALGRQEAAKYLSVSARFLDKRAKAGEIRRCKLGTRSVFLIKDLDFFLESRIHRVKKSKPCQN